MKLFSLTFGDRSAASTLYRVLQYQPYLEKDGIQLDWKPAVNFTGKEDLADYDCVILQKSLLPKSRFAHIRNQSKRLIYDLDDAIWHRPENDYSWWTRRKQLQRLKHITRHCDRSLCANQFLADKLGSLGAIDPRVVPMSIDPNHWNPSESNLENGGDGSPPTIGWSGSPKNLTYLEHFLPAWLEIHQSFPGVRWIIHCGKKPELKGLDFEYLPYVSGEEPAAVKRFDIGLLPLPSDAFSQGKSPIKALQYLAMGTAIVATPACATRELLTQPESTLWASSSSEWVEALRKYIQDPDLLRQAKKAGQNYFHDHHSSELVYQQWKHEILQ